MVENISAAVIVIPFNGLNEMHTKEKEVATKCQNLCFVHRTNIAATPLECSVECPLCLKWRELRPEASISIFSVRQTPPFYCTKCSISHVFRRTCQSANVIYWSTSTGGNIWQREGAGPHSIDFLPFWQISADFSGYFLSWQYTAGLAVSMCVTL